jgi:hypothetical protein
MEVACWILENEVLLAREAYTRRAHVCIVATASALLDLRYGGLPRQGRPVRPVTYHPLDDVGDSQDARNDVP